MCAVTTENSCDRLLAYSFYLYGQCKVLNTIYSLNVSDNQGKSILLLVFHTTACLSHCLQSQCSHSLAIIYCFVFTSITISSPAEDRYLLMQGDLLFV